MRRLARSSSLITCSIFSLALLVSTGCDGGEPGTPPQIDTADGGTGDGGDADGSDTDVPTPQPTLQCEIQLQSTFQPFENLGETLTLSESDEPAPYVDTEGFQTNFFARTQNIPEGTAIRLLFGEVEQQSAALNIDEAGDKLFANITIPEGQTDVVMEATVDGETIRCNSLALVRDTGLCDIDLTPLPGNCLTADANADLSGIQLQFTISNGNQRCTEAFLQYDLGDGPVTSEPQTLTNGSTIVEITVSNADVDRVSVDVQAVVRNPDNSSVTNQTPTNTYVADNEAPVLSISNPTDGATLGLAADADPEQPGVQIAVTGSAEGWTALGQENVVITSSADETAVPTLSADGSWKVELTFDTSGEYTVTATATDECENASQSEITFQVSTAPSLLTIVTPTDGATLWANADPDPSTAYTFEQTFEIAADKIEAPVTMTVICEATGPDPVPIIVGEATFDEEAELYPVPCALDINLLSTAMACRVTDGITNPAINPSLSSPIQVNVALPASWLRIDSPKDQTALTTTEILLLASGNNLNGIAGTLSVSNEAGPVYTLDLSAVTVNDGLSQAVWLTEDGTESGVQLADGAYTVTLASTDALGNISCDHPESLCSVTVTLDTVAPTVTIYAPEKATLDPNTDPDTSADLGYQTDIGVWIEGPEDAVGSSVCLSVNGQPLGCQTTAGDTNSVQWPGVTLQPGTNTIIATATDAAGNESLPASIDVVYLSDAPVVTITQPEQDTSTVDSLANIQVTVSEAGTPTSGGTVGLYVNGVLSDVTATDNGAGGYAFSDILLIPGLNTLVAEATLDDGTAGYSAPRLITQKENEPTIEFSSPADGQTLSKSSPECAGGSTACDLTVSCATQNVDNGSIATLQWSCGNGLSTANGVVFNDQVLFPVSLPNNASCSLVCSAIDKGTEQQPESSPITVSIDLTSPTFGDYVKPGSNILIFTDDEDPLTSEFEYSVRLQVGGLEAGQTVNLLATGPDFSAELTPVTIETAIPDGSLEILQFEQAVYPQGIVTFIATTSDKAGNAAAALVTAVEIASEQPLVRISDPVYIEASSCTTNEDCLGDGAICVDGTCGYGWGTNSPTSINVVTSGIPSLPQNLRICSNHPSLVNNTPCEASNTVGGGSFHVLHQVDMSGNVQTVEIGSLLVDGIHTLVAEAKLSLDGSQWETSLSAAAIDQSRLVLVDTIVPAVAAVTSDNDVDESGCIKATEAAQGVAVTTSCSKAGTVTLALETETVATLPCEADTATIFEDIDVFEGTHNFSVVCTDLVKNTSPAADYVVDIDQTLPTLAFVKPTSGPLLAGADLDIVLASDAIGQQVTLHSNVSGSVGSAGVGTNGEALFPHADYATLVDGAHILTSSALDACGNESLAQIGPIQVDVVPPTITLTSPADAVELTDAEDASANPGFQASLTFATTGDASSWEIRVESDCDNTFSNCNAASVFATGNIENPDGEEAAQLLTLPVFKTPDFLRVTVWTTDTAGNTAEDTHDIPITLTACNALLQGLPADGQINNSLCAESPGENCESITANFEALFVGACGGIDSATLRENGAIVASATVTDGVASFSREMIHATTVTLEVETGDGSISTGPTQLNTDLHAPEPSFVAATVQGFTTPASNSAVSYAIADDQDASTAGLQVHLQVDGTDSGFGDGQFLSITAGETTVTSTLPVAYSGTSATITLTDISLPDGENVACTITMTDLAGNVGTSSFTYSSDSVAPSAPNLTIDSFNRRRPSVTLSWPAPGDDGTTGAAAAAYELRYSKFPLSESTFDEACDATALLTAAPAPTPKLPNESESYVISGPDARGPDYQENGQDCHLVMHNGGGAHYFAVRAWDEAGNKGPIGVISTTELGVRGARFAITGNKAHSDFDSRVSRIGDINNDGFADFALGGNQTSGICIFYGSNSNTVPDLSIDPESDPTGSNYQCILDATVTRAGAPSLNIGDVNGDGLQDLGIASGKKSLGAPNEVRIYYGVDGGQIANQPDFVITGFLEYVLRARFDGGGNFNGDTSDHDGDAQTPEIPVMDIVVGSRHAEEIFVIPGSTSWPAGGTCDLSDPADRASYNVVTFQMTGGGGSSQFGAGNYFVGNILPDAGSLQYDDILISAYGIDTTTQAVLLKGRPITGAQVFTVSAAHDGSEPEDAQSVQLKPDTVGSNNFGDAASARDYDGNGTLDLFVFHSKNQGDGKPVLYLYDGAALQNSIGGTLIVDGTTAGGEDQLLGTNGLVFTGAWRGFGTIGNFNDDPNATFSPISIGYRSASPQDYGAAFLRFNTQQPVPGHAYGSFPYYDMLLFDPTDPTNLTFSDRDVLDVGDVNGDGLTDLVIGTSGNGYAVLIY